MLRAFPALCFIVTFAASLLTGCKKEAPQKAETGQVAMAVQVATERPGMLQSGEALFKQYCAACHPNGGNVSDPKRALYGSVLKSNHITTPEDSVRIMRHPLSRMIRFDASTLSDKDARAIAEYVLKAFR